MKLFSTPVEKLENKYGCLEVSKLPTHMDLLEIHS